MNKKQLKAVENFQNAYDRLIKEGLDIIISDDSTFIYRVKDIDTSIQEGEYGVDHAQLMDLLKNEKGIHMNIDIKMYNNI